MLVKSKPQISNYLNHRLNIFFDWLHDSLILLEFQRCESILCLDDGVTYILCLYLNFCAVASSEFCAQLYVIMVSI